MYYFKKLHKNGKVIYTYLLWNESFIIFYKSKYFANKDLFFNKVNYPSKVPKFLIGAFKLS